MSDPGSPSFSTAAEPPSPSRDRKVQVLVTKRPYAIDDAEAVVDEHLSKENKQILDIQEISREGKHKRGQSHSNSNSTEMGSEHRALFDEDVKIIRETVSAGGKGNLIVNQPSQEATESVASSNSIEDNVTLFEHILHPEMLEAMRQLKTLDFEQNNLVKVFFEKIGEDILDPDLAEALKMEVGLRTTEKAKVLEEFEKVEEAKNKSVQDLIASTKKMRQENNALKKALEQKKKRHEGSGEDLYDWVVDIRLLSELASKGWKVAISKKFKDKWSKERKSRSTKFEGAVVGVVGLYDKGKTFVLNQITRARLPSGKKVSTNGLSFKHVNVESSKFILLDSAGSYSPVKVQNELSVAQKEATEHFLMDLIFDLSDYFICVVNDFTSLDQRYLDKLMRLLQNSNKTFREVIVVHNLKEVTHERVLDHIWRDQVTHVYADGCNMNTMVAARDHTGQLKNKKVTWFKTRFSRHVILANHDSDLGRKVNPWATALLRYWLKSVFVPVDREFKVINTVVQRATKRLQIFLQRPVELVLHPGKDEQTMYIKPKLNEDNPKESENAFQLPQIALDATGLMLARPDSYMPPVDILLTPERYTVLVDIPGMTANDVSLSRKNVITIMKGKRSPPYDRKDVSVIKQERRYGEFTLTFNIPQQYERKWVSCSVEEGVLQMHYKQDTQEVSSNPYIQHIGPTGEKTTSSLEEKK
mmetsp:Transcript_3483/g.5205  ORF Transcript_3483/g.5205 Transcript_3483/m.5205 type:complete len:700 (+) Transcript_3483:206-2305(+)